MPEQERPPPPLSAGGRGVRAVDQYASMSPLFSSRAGVSIFGGGVACEATWPLGKVSLDRDCLTVSALLMSYHISIGHIDRIRAGWLGVRVEHHAPDVPRLVSFWGFGLGRGLREAIKRNDIRVEVVT